MVESRSLRSGCILSYHLAPLFYKWGNRAPERWGNFSKVPEHLSDRGTWTKLQQPPKQYIFHWNMPGLCASPTSIIFTVNIPSGYFQSSSNFSYYVLLSNHMICFSFKLVDYIFDSQNNDCPMCWFHIRSPLQTLPIAFPIIWISGSAERQIHLSWVQLNFHLCAPHCISKSPWDSYQP